MRAHEFHYASLENLPTDVRCAYAVKRGHGIDGERDGVVVGSYFRGARVCADANANARCDVGEPATLSGAVAIAMKVEDGESRGLCSPFDAVTTLVA